MSTNIIATTKWLRYFAAAGIPSNAAANYAVIFTENRIQPDMLLDLNKEYLYDMGIRVMGDVIAILRYARTAYTEEAQKKILGEDSNDRLLQKTQSSINEKIVIPTQKRTNSSFNTPSDRLSAKLEKPKSNPVKRVANPIPVKVKKIVSLKRTADDLDDESLDEPPPPRTSKIQKLSNNMKTVTVVKDTSKNSGTSSTLVKGSVFRRLGESSVSSSTDSVTSSVQLQPHSIFERLGPASSKAKVVSTQVVASSTISESKPKTLSSFKNGGVFKTISLKREIKNPAASVTSGAALRGKVEADVSKIRLKQTVKNRLGIKPTSSSAVSTTSETTYNSQRRLLQRSLAGFESQNQKTIIKLSQRPKATTVIKTSGLSTRGSSLRSNVSQSSRPITGLMSDSLSTSERIVKKPKQIFTKPKASIFSRLGPV